MSESPRSVFEALLESHIAQVASHGNTVETLTGARKAPPAQLQEVRAEWMARCDHAESHWPSCGGAASLECGAEPPRRCYCDRDD